MPARGSVLSGSFRPLDGQLPPEALYGYVADSRYLPEECPLYGQLSPGAWLYTAAAPVQIKVGAGQYRFSFGFPAGGTHYFLLQGIQPMKSVMLHEILWKPDPEYSRYSDGWVYDAGTQTLFGKLTHRLPEEEPGDKLLTCRYCGPSARYLRTDALSPRAGRRYVVFMESTTAVLDVNGARCASCSFAIEHMGRKVPGVEEVRVYPDSQEIHVKLRRGPGGAGSDHPHRQPAGLRSTTANRGVVYTCRPSPLY